MSTTTVALHVPLRMTRRTPWMSVVKVRGFHGHLSLFGRDDLVGQNGLVGQNDFVRQDDLDELDRLDGFTKILDPGSLKRLASPKEVGRGCRIDAPPRARRILDGHHRRGLT